MVDYATDASRQSRLTARLGPRTLLLGGVFLAAWGALVSSVSDPDFWWHVATGRWMVEHGGLPTHDLFTYTVPAHAWTDHEYLTEVAMWLVFSHAGPAALSLAFGAITWAGIYLLWVTSDGRRQPYVIAALGIVLAVLAGGPIWGPRAQMITFLASCLELLWLRRYLEGRSRAINFLPLVMVVWANLHGGWAVGFGFLGVALAAEVVRWLLDRGDAAARAHLRRLAIVTGLCVLAVLATPHGFSLLLYPLQTQGSVAQQQLIVEWFSPDFHQPVMYPFLAMIVATLGAFALRRPSLYDFLLTVAVLGLALHSVRHIAIFVAAVTPILINSWSQIWREQSARRRWALPTSKPAAVMAAITAAALVVVGAATAFKIASDLIQQDRVTRATYPVAAVDWIQAHPGQVGTRMYNQYGWGGYLIYRFYPVQPGSARKVYIFGEAELMGDPQLNRYQDVQTLRPDWLRILDQDRVDYVIYNRDEALSNVLATEPGWRLAYQDSVAVIYVRASR